MKGTKLTLLLSAALALAGTANADDHRGRGDRDGKRQVESKAMYSGSKFRANAPRARQDSRAYRDRDRHYRDARRYRDHRHDWRHRNDWRAKTYHRRNWRPPPPTRSSWRADRRHDYRAGHRHRRAGAICFSDHRYERRAFTLWLDGIGLRLVQPRY